MTSMGTTKETVHLLCWSKQNADMVRAHLNLSFSLLKGLLFKAWGFSNSPLPPFKNVLSSPTFTSGCKIPKNLFWCQLFQEHLYFNRELSTELRSLSSHWHLSGNLRILPGRVLLPGNCKGTLLAWCLHWWLLLEYRLRDSYCHQGRLL